MSDPATHTFPPPIDLGDLAYFDFATGADMAGSIAEYRADQGCVVVHIYKAQEIEARKVLSCPPPAGPTLALPVGDLWVVVSRRHAG